jgi:AraC-like DNA-binding protein
VLKRRAPEGAFEHQRIAPAPALEPFVAHFWMVRWDLRGLEPYLAETLPHPCVQVTFERGRARVGGCGTRRFRRWLRGRDRVFGIKFRPGAFQPLFRAPLARLTDRTIGLRSVFGRDGDALKEAILGEPDVQRCVALAEAFLQERLPPMPPEIAALRDFVERLAADPGITRAEQAAALAGVDLRQLQRRFRAAVGVSPKWVIQRYRLHEAAERLASANAPEMTSLALQLGYYDQSHFIRDFKAVVGVSPGDYAARAGAKGWRPVRPGSFRR